MKISFIKSIAVFTVVMGTLQSCNTADSIINPEVAIDAITSDALTGGGTNSTHMDTTMSP